MHLHLTAYIFVERELWLVEVGADAMKKNAKLRFENFCGSPFDHLTDKREGTSRQQHPLI